MIPEKEAFPFECIEAAEPTANPPFAVTIPANAALPLCWIDERPTVTPAPVVVNLTSLLWSKITDPPGENLAMFSSSATFLILRPLVRISSVPDPLSLILLLFVSWNISRPSVEPAVPPNIAFVLSLNTKWPSELSHIMSLLEVPLKVKSTPSLTDPDAWIWIESI